MTKEKLAEIKSFMEETLRALQTRYKSEPNTAPFQELQAIVAMVFQHQDIDPQIKSEVPVLKLGWLNESAKVIAKHSWGYTYSDLDNIIFHLNRLRLIFEETLRRKSDSLKSVFYSWQSDRKNNTNRGFIKDAIENVLPRIKSIRDLSIDHDTRDTPGAPDISETIFKKIDGCLIFIADITPVAEINGDMYPNANVLFELGYAIRAIGPSRIITVFNSSFGVIEQLPFDLRFKRHMVYSCAEVEENRSEKRRILEKTLEDGIKSIIQNLGDE